MRRTHLARLFAMLLPLCFITTFAHARKKAAPAEPAKTDLSDRVTILEKEVQELRAELVALRQKDSGAAVAILAEARLPVAGELPSPAAPIGEAAVAGAGIAPAKVQSGLLAGATPIASLDVYGSYSQHQPSSGVSGLRLFDNQTNQFALNLLELGLAKQPEDSSRFGYDVTLGFGNAINIINSNDPGGLGFAQYLKDGYAAYLVPAGRGLQIDVGKFSTPAGPEVIESYANWNYSRGLLFDFALPFYVFGARAKYDFNEQFALTGYFVNGWNNIVDTYGSDKTFGMRADWKPTSKIFLAETWFGGKEPTPTSVGRRNLSDTILGFTPTSKLSLMATADYSRSMFLFPYRVPVHWFGAGAYARYQIFPALAAAARYEYFDDPFGVATCGACATVTPQHVNEVTTTAEVRLQRHFLARLEYRYDRSNQPVFFRDFTPIPQQATITLGLMFVVQPQDGFKPLATDPGLR